MFAGPRAEELCLARRRDFNIANERMQIGRSKTAAGLRDIYPLKILGQILTDHFAHAVYDGPDDLAFATSKGTARDKDNLRSRVFALGRRSANELLIARDQQPLPENLTPHKLRPPLPDPRSNAWWRGPDLGHAAARPTNPNFTLRVYAHMMRRSPAERARLRALVNQPVRPLAIPAPTRAATSVSIFASGVTAQASEPTWPRAAQKACWAVSGHAEIESSQSQSAGSDPSEVDGAVDRERPVNAADIAVCASRRAGGGPHW